MQENRFPTVRLEAFQSFLQQEGYIMNIAVLLSGGAGRRMGSDIPKQYIRVSGKMLITYSLETLLAHPLIDAVQIVAGKKWREDILADLRKSRLATEKICGFSVPGAERQSSIFHALKDIKGSGITSIRSANNMSIISSAGNKSNTSSKSGTEGSMDAVYYSDYQHNSVQDVQTMHTVLAHNVISAYNVVQTAYTILIHDAVRPNLTKEQITACFAALKNHDGVMPVLPMKDTVYLSDGGRCVSELLDRKKIFAGQAPEVFAFDKYYAANLRLLPDGLRRINGSTEPAVMAGMNIVMIPGDENNYKITTKADLEHFRRQKEQFF